MEAVKLLENDDKNSPDSYHLATIHPDSQTPKPVSD